MVINNWLQVIESTALDAARAVKPLLGTVDARTGLGTGAGGDETNLVDDVAERTILECLEKTGEPLHVVTEERGLLFLNNGQENPSRYLIIDPVDGSFNAERGIPLVSISIAAATGPSVSDLSEAIVVNIPSGDTYTAQRGKGAWFNGSPAKVPGPGQGPASLREAAMGIDLNPKRAGTSRTGYVAGLGALMDLPMKVRVLGSNALGIALVSTGALDVFVDLRCNLRLLDIAAAYLVVTEAGGLVFSFEDGALREFGEKPLDIQSQVSVVAVGNHQLKRSFEEASQGLFLSGRDQ